MNMTDMLLQMTLQSVWQMSQTTQGAGQTANTQDHQGGTSFQDLLEQRREDTTQAGKEDTNLKDPQGDQNVGTSEKPDKDSPNANLEVVAAAAAPAVYSDLMAVQANFVEAVGSAESPVAQVVTIEAAVADTQTVLTAQSQVQAGTVLPQVQRETAQPQQTVQPETTSDVQAAPVSVLQSSETVSQSADTQSTAQENLSQDMTQSAAAQTGSDEGKDVTVESFQTPLFQNVEATPVRVGEGESVDMTAPAQEVEKSLSNILKGALDQGDQHVEIKLNPANLGTVTAEFTRTPEGVLHVVLHAETEQTARLLSDHASTLGLILQDNTHSEVRVQVAQPQENQSAWQHPDQDGGQQQQQSHQQQQRNTPRQEAENFLHQLRLGLLEMETDAV
ncbi:flagellar hook-length control protein FliK [Lawsonibacter sp. LCP25S3_G6]|uniref:flagellar hook-length control protein FliK n=1 Tax=unclassified Lawsonibacter TaxID=2617946 RepID=UPI003F9CB7BF